MQRYSALTFTCLLTLATAFDKKEYLDYLGKLTVNESMLEESSDFLDKRKTLMDEHLYPEGNKLLGAPDFHCPTMGARSQTPPTSVHALRVNDIAAVGALGDSLTAGFGAGAQSLLEMPMEYRGLAFSIGGDSDLMFSSTLPNILSQFNPSVVGASTRVSPQWYEYLSKFNVAVSGSEAINMTEQASELVRRMQDSTDFDFANEWKLVTIFIGSNDLCSYCKDTERRSPQNYKMHLQSAIDTLRARLPKTLVSIVSPEHVELLRVLNKASNYCTKLHECVFLHFNGVEIVLRTSCPCVNDKSLTPVVKQYQNAVLELQKAYEGSDNFAVVVQTFSSKQAIPFDSTGVPDFSFFAPDCFHFSHYGHALISKALFNNMHEPVDAKATHYALAEIELKCPDETCPFIRTPGNANCGAVIAKAPKLVQSSTFKKKTKKAEMVLPAVPQSAVDAPQYVPVLVKDSGSTVGLVLVGLALGLVLGMVVGSIAYNAWQTKLHYNRVFSFASEKTPLLRQRGLQQYNTDDQNCVEIY